MTFAAPGVLDAVAIPNIIFHPSNEIRDGYEVVVNVLKPRFIGILFRLMPFLIRLAMHENPLQYRHE